VTNRRIRLAKDIRRFPSLTRSALSLRDLRKRLPRRIGRWESRILQGQFQVLSRRAGFFAAM
jgi:hypothetical protein